MANENCVRVPRDEAEALGWVSRVKGKLREAKEKYLTTSAMNVRGFEEDAQDLKPLMDYQDSRHAIDNQADNLRMLLNSYFEKDRTKGLTEADKFYQEEAQAWVDGGGTLQREPTSPEDAVNLGQHYAELNALNKFRDDGVKNGVVGKQTNPNFKSVGKRNYRELQVRGNPGEQMGILPHLRKAHEDVFSGLEKDPKPWGIFDPLRKTKAMSTAMIMWSPFFHTVNIGSRWLIPMLVRKENLSPAGVARSVRAFKDATRDYTSPDRIKELGGQGLNLLGNHGWRETDVPQLRSLFYKVPGVEKVVAPILSVIDKTMPTAINYMGLVAYHMRVNDLVRAGRDPRIARTLAARETSILMGTISKDSLTRGWRNFADAALFSTRYTTTTLQMFSKALTKDEALRKRLASQGFDTEKIQQALQDHQQHFQRLLIKDYLAMLAFANLTNLYFTGLYNMPDKNGKKGAHAIWDNPGSNWYKDFVNVKAVMGVDPDTHKPILIGTPFRSTRDIAELLTDWYAVASGAENSATIFQSQINKGNQVVAAIADMVKGTDWAGRTLNQPTSATTMANYSGDLIERLMPIDQARAILVSAVTRVEGGDPEVWKDMVNSMDDTSVKRLVARALGGQVSSGEQYGQPRAEAYAAQQRVQSWMANPVVRKALAKNDPKIMQMARQFLHRAGITGSAAEKEIQRAVRSQGAERPPSKSVREYQQENP